VTDSTDAVQQGGGAAGDGVADGWTAGLAAGVRMRFDVRVPMRDGVRLSADVYLPDTAGPFPTVLMRTPYDNNTAPLIEKGRRLASQGYAVVIQDCRGRYDSDGTYYPFVNEGEDGYDTQEWIGRQPWSNGKIGTAGGSYLGLTQWTSAPHGSGFLTCMAPRVICADFFSGLVYPGGAFQLNVMMTWGMRTSGHTGQSIDYDNWTEAFRLLPLREADRLAGRDLAFWRDWLDHPRYDECWRQMDVRPRWGDMAVPALNMGGWYDLYVSQTFENFNGLRQRGGSAAARQSQLIVGPWPHALSASTRTGDVDFGAGSLYDLETLERRWFDHWLKGIDNGISREGPLRLFIMGANTWRDEREWPLARTEWQRWYLHSGGRANTLLGDGALAPPAPAEEPPDHYAYHPDYPVPTRGGNNCCSPQIVPWGAYDQRDVEMRHDVLCYTSAPLERDLEVTGPIAVTLYAATGAPDTDWTAKLVDVWPSGYAMNLCDGIVRARYRESVTDPQPVTPGTVYEYTIEQMVTGNVFRRGHRIRLEVSSSNFPRFDRNLNTGQPAGAGVAGQPAHQTVLHDQAHPSHVLLPVIP
jgi:putative CocE/NonD family hydrolase